MGRPLFVEGEPGVGKTEIAKVLASSICGGELIRLQCYEGLDASHALYEWDYARQMLAIRLLEAKGGDVDVQDIMSEEYLIARPLLQAIRRLIRGSCPRCCSSMNSIGPMRSSRLTCSSFCPTSRSRFLRSGR